MTKITVDVGTGFYQSDALSFSNQRCVNLYPNLPQAPALKTSSLFNVQGLRQIEKTGDLLFDQNRGGWRFSGAPYFVNGDKLYRIDRTVNDDESVTYSRVELGTVPGKGFCSFSDNGNQLIIINNLGDGYVYQPGASPEFEAISDAGFSANGTPQQVVFIDSYFIVTTDDRKAIVSAPNDGKSWNALDRITAEADPDSIVAPFVYRNQLYILGTQTCETFTNIGGAGVPFQRVNGFVLSQGCTSPFSVTQLGNYVAWVGRGENEQPAVYLFDGNVPVKVSTTAIENKLHEISESDLESIFTWSYSLRGNEFIGINTNEFTFVFDIKTQRWHERQSLVRDPRGLRNEKRCRINCVLSAYNELLVGDSEDGRIGIIDVNSYMEYDEPLQSFFTTQPLYDLGNSFSLPMVELLCESGVGSRTVDDPKVRMQISRDGAVFSNSRTRSLGKQGDRKRRQIWYRNGRVSRLCIFKFIISDPIKRRIFGVEIDYKQSA